jgi:hypothetical protein
VNNANFAPFKNEKCQNEQLHTKQKRCQNTNSEQYEEYSNLMERDDIFRCGQLNPNISSNYI